ncbi:MAG: PVC-type heme-binding CxxCH protein, partial [Planctomycetota bacterium]
VQLEKFELLEGYQVNLFASDPDIANPVHMTWDARGRLWVVCSWSYPQMKPGEKPNDKIIILEDTDGDGAADKSTVFAEDLYIPTGLQLANGGCYVAQAPDILFLKDTDGDDRADIRQTVLTGFGIEDSHHAISAWRRGPGGWIYFQEGVFLHSQVETQYGTVRLTDGGVFQYMPRTGELKVYADMRVGNPWGHIFDDWGQSIFIDNPRVYFLGPATTNSRAKLRFDPLLSTEKQCGGDVILSSHFPDELQGQIVTNRFKSQRVARYSFADDGSGMSAKLEEPIIWTKHPNFRPVDTKIGPDGALYVCDWYNPIINHAGHDFRDPLRDVQHGRIWRITHKERPLVKPPKLEGAPLAELLEHLKSPEQWTRHYAKLVLSEMDPHTVARGVDSWAAGLDPSDPRYDHHLIEALWTYQHVGLVSEDLLKQALKVKTGEARAAAVRVIRYWHPHLSDPLALLDKAVQDEFARVRLEAVMSLSYVPHAQSLPIALKALDKPTDRFLDHALTMAMDGLSPHWIPAAKNETIEFYSPEHRDFAMAANAINLTKQLESRFANKSGLESAQLQRLLEQVVLKGTQREVNYLVEQIATGRGHNAVVMSWVMGALTQTATQRGVKPSGKWMAKALGLVRHKDRDLKLLAIKMVAAWRYEDANVRLKPLLKGDDVELQLAAAQAMGAIGSQDNRAMFDAMVLPERPIAKRYLGLIGMASWRVAVAAKAAPDILAQDPAGADPVPVVEAFVSRSAGANQLLREFEKSELKPHPTVAQAISTYVASTGRVSGKLAELFTPTQSAASLSQRLLAEDALQLADEAWAKGDPARGEQIFRRVELACVACHPIAGAGPTLAPDLAAIGSATGTDYIVDSILRPSKVIAEHYGSVAVTTKDNQVLIGVHVFSGEREVVIRDSQNLGQNITIPGANVKSVAKLPSLMPATLADL